MSTETLRNPSMMAVVTSCEWPYLNHNVRRRSVSCSEFPGESAIERKKATKPRQSRSSLVDLNSPCTEGTR